MLVEGVDDDVDSREQVGAVAAGEGGVYGGQGDGGIDLGEAFGRSAYLGPAEKGGGAQELAVQIVLLELVRVDGHQVADPEAGQGFQDIAAEAAAADDRYGALEKAQLVGGGDHVAVAPVARG